MGLYTNFESKVTKVAKKVAFVKRNRFPIIGVISTLLAFLFTMLGVSGIIQSDLVLNKEEYIYGETLAYNKADAFASSVHYEYALKGDNPSWTEVIPTTVGEYYMRTYTYNGYRIRRYGETREFRILPKEIDLEVTSQSVVYGEEPLTNALQVLNRGDSIDFIDLKYDSLINLTRDEVYGGNYTNVEIDLNSLKIVNERGIDVTSSYKINTEKRRIRINKRSITLSSNSLSKEYDGSPLSDSEVKIVNGSLAENDSFNITPQAVGSITDFSYSSVKNEIVPSNGENGLKIINPTLGDVTHLYNIEYIEGYLSVNKKRDLKITGPIYRSEYNGTYQTPPIDSYSASSLNVSGLAPTDKIQNVRFGFNSGSILHGQRDFAVEYDIVNNQGQNVEHNYNIDFDPGRMIITKKDITITPIASIYDRYDEASQKYTRVYDGNSVQIRYENFDNQLCSNDSASLVNNLSHYNPGTYPNISDGLGVKITNSIRGEDVTSQAYNISFVTRSLEITKRDVIINIQDLNLFETTNSLDENMISYAITTGSLLTTYNHRIKFTFNPSRERYLSAGNYNLLDYFSVSITNSYGTDQSSYYNIVTNQPRINVRRAKFALNINKEISDIEKTYNGSSQSIIISYSTAISSPIKINEDNSTLPGSYRLNNLVISTSLTDVEKHFFTKNDITTFSANYQIDVDKNGTSSRQTLAFSLSTVDFEFYNSNYFEIKARDIDVSFSPKLKFYDGKAFDPNVLVSKNLYTMNSGALATNHKFKFTSNQNIVNVGSYSPNDLKNAFTLKIVDSSDIDRTKNYNLNYSFSQPLVIQRANLTIRIKDKSTSVESGRTVGDLLTKTYNDVETNVFNSASNDRGFSNYSSIYTLESNLQNEGYWDNNNITLNLGIEPEKDVGSYDIVVKSFRISTNSNDIYQSEFDSSRNRECIDVNIENGSSMYEIKKRTINFTIPSLTFICDGSAIDYNFELDTENLKSQLLTNHTLEVTGNSITTAGSYTAAQAGIDLKIYDAIGSDVTSNYQLNWTNRSSFRITAEDARVIIRRSSSYTSPTRTYDGTNWKEEQFYDSITSSNATNGAKHSYTFEFRFKNNYIPDHYFDAGVVNLPSNYPASSYTDIYCTKTYSDGRSNTFIAKNIEYNITGAKQATTERRNLVVEISDELYWTSNSDYTFDYSIKAGSVNPRGEGLAEGDRIASLSISRNNGINGNELSTGISTKSFNVADYAHLFSIEIYNDNRRKDVTGNYNISYSGSITYKKPSLALNILTQTKEYTGEEYAIGNANATSINLPQGASYEVTYNYTTPNGQTFTATNYTESRIGNYHFSISSVKVFYNGEDITQFVALSYPTSATGRTTITKSSLRVVTGTFELGYGFIYNLDKPSITHASGFESVSKFSIAFTVEFGKLVDDPNGLFIIDGDGNLIPVDYGTTQNQVRTIRIINNATGEDVTDCFDIEWVIGTIEIRDISIT